MAGRRAEPVDVLIAKGKKHLTKEEIEQRKKNEIHFGEHRPMCPFYVKRDPVALKKWKELINYYKKASANNVDIIESSDAGIMAMYCKTFSEYQELLKAHQRISEINYDCEDLKEAIDGEDEAGDRLFSGKVRKQLSDLFSITAILNVESAVNRKLDMLLKMGDRLFLDPLAKIKNVIKSDKPSAPDPNADMFGDG